MKAKGWEVRDFYVNGFPEGYYHDDYDESEMAKFENENGEVIVADDEVIDLESFGVLCPDDLEKHGEYIPFSTAFRRWRKSKPPIGLDAQLKGLLKVTVERKYKEAEAWLRERLQEAK